MIQSVNAVNSRAGFRESNRVIGNASKKSFCNAGALYTSAGVTVAAGALTAAIARGYTNSWTKAGVVGFLGALSAMFFLTPKMVFGHKKTL